MDEKQPSAEALKVAESFLFPPLSSGLSAAVITTTRLARALDAFAARSRWQPIETAQKDGTRIVISDGDVPAVGMWSARTERWIVDWDHEKYDDPAPTIWCPLPEPPSCP